MAAKQWCPWWGDDQRRRFLGEVEEVAAARWDAHDLDAEAGTLAVPALGTTLTLAPVARACTAVPQAGWRAQVYEFCSWAEARSPERLWRHFSAMTAAEAAAGMKLLAHQAQPGRPRPAGQEIAGGLMTVLAHEYDGSPVPLPAHQLDEWGLDAAEMHETAKQAVFDRYPLCREPGPEGKWDYYTGHSPFASGNLASMDKIAPGAGPAGVLVAVPAAQMILAAAVGPWWPDEYRETLSSLFSASIVVHSAANCPISPAVVWVQSPGLAREVAGFSAEGRPRLRCPSELRKIMRGRGAQGLDLD